MDTPSSPLRVGFDMDGVLLYNPARIIRPFVSSVKKMFLKNKQLHFYFPQTKGEQFMWKLFHKSSIFNAPGLDEITELVRRGKITAYLVTARYSFLGKEVEDWVRKNKLDRTFTGVYSNTQNEQPHEFKERMIRKLKLDIFVEDNFDIVNHLSKTTPAEIIWIYNIFDRGIPFPKKFPHLSSVVALLKK